MVNHLSSIKRAWLACLTVLFIILATACSSTQDQEANLPPSSAEDIISGLQIVDCLLPGQLRKLGNMSYMSPRRPVKTTAADCRIRGGEYVAYDRADYKTALNVWLPSAEQGDAEAQLAVGEIFEKGLGTEPNYEVALFWYQKAAEQGNKSALFNLGTLYEQGLGVEKDRLVAINYYRQAWGMPENSLIYQETAEREQQALRAELAQQLKAKDQQLALLDKQMASLQQELKTTESESSTKTPSADLATLQQLLKSVHNDRASVEHRLSTIPKLRTPSVVLPTVAPVSGGDGLKAGEVDFGRYYALVIGNKDYSVLDDLETPLNDAKEIGEILENQYGFQVQLLLNSDRLTVMQAINELHSVLTDKDNLLIYYAGHGSMVNVGERDTGYWLPINADPPPNDSFWVSNEFVSNHLGRLQAKRVLVIADSCYGGLLSSAPGQLFMGERRVSDNPEYIKYKLPRRSRLLLSSGGDKPVIDQGGDGHSVFARELINSLRANKGVLSVPDLYVQIREPVKRQAKVNNFVQEPVYKIIKGAGHEVGDFFFVPTTAIN
ncbi:Sel1-repeat-containing protein YbeT [Zhongshania aliphaticivorans]|uniref:Sel1-repeat-containing protein YbeT n=1 Tax=Zhongshania aliphaticivorans TaxID=1470434 RepID=A0A5S9QCX3_9GAMM|nr:Sel1-repeat-containing protein YbeT [Zhongshania aliphaticivorans]CAA0116163.1 Sel1-repeat-containing protein YbeT [Zhongshania aliphaticivorans]CAA0120378.1 Sel1-repeat-containing protein YbeT [Zhongshania aliphaticivorans]